MFKKLVFIAVALVGAASMGFSQNVPNDPETKVGKLDNGMTYFIRHNDKPAQRAEFYLATNAGALQETPDQDGLAHFLEHMCFNGTKNFPGKGIINWLESIGASFGGNVNAGTGVEQTIYMLTNIPLVRSTVVDTCLLIMHDYSHFVNCDPAEIDAERGVILEERRTRNTASWRLREANKPAIYGDTKYATTTIIGSEENLKTFKPESLTNFYHTWYTPNRQALIVVGDIDVNEVEAKIKATFADIPAPENPKEEDVITIPDNKDPLISIFTDPELRSTNVEVMFKTKPLPKEARATVNGVAVGLLKEVIAQVLNERLTDICQNPESPFIQAVFGFSSLCNVMDATYISSSAKEGKALEALNSLLVELKKMQLYGFDDGEIARAKSEIISSCEAWAKSADTRKNSDFITPIYTYFFTGDPYMDPSTKLELTKAVLQQFNTEVFNQAVKELITEENMVVLYNSASREGLSHPTEAQIRETIAAVKTAEIARPAGEEIPTELLDVSKLKGSKAGKASKGIYGSTVYTLKNGVRLVLLPTDHEKNQVRFSITKKGGYSLVAQEDLPSFEANIWTLYQNNTGVSAFSRPILAKMLAGKQLSVGPSISDYAHSISGSSTTNDIETALQLAYLYYTDPRFDENEYNQGIQQIETVLPNLEKTPDWVFQNELYETIYDSPRFVSLSREVLSKASLKTLEKNYRMLFNDAVGATMYMVGDFKIDDVLPMLEKYIGSIKKGKKASELGDISSIYAKGKKVNDFNAVMQTPKVTFVQVYLVDAPYTVKDDVNSRALSYILDMKYTSTLREGEGATYGAQCGASVSEYPVNKRMLQVLCETNNEMANKLRELAIQGLRDIAENGPNAEEYDKAVKNAEKLLPENRIKNGYWSSNLRKYDLYGFDFDLEYEKAVKELSPEAIKQAAKDYLNSDTFFDVVMRPASE